VSDEDQNLVTMPTHEKPKQGEESTDDISIDNSIASQTQNKEIDEKEEQTETETETEIQWKFMNGDKLDPKILKLLQNIFPPVSQNPQKQQSESQLQQQSRSYPFRKTPLNSFEHETSLKSKNPFKNSDFIPSEEVSTEYSEEESSRSSSDVDEDNSRTSEESSNTEELLDHQDFETSDDNIEVSDLFSEIKIYTMTGNGKVRKLSSEYINNIFEGMNVSPLLKKLKEGKKKIGNSENDDDRSMGDSSVNEEEWIARGLRKENTKSNDNGGADIINLDSTPVSTSSDQSSSTPSAISSSSSDSSPTSTQDATEATTSYRSEE